MKIIRRLVFFISALIVAINLGPAYADSSPPLLPQIFYGTLKIAGLPASGGAIVEARGTGVVSGISGNPISTNGTGVYDNLIVQGSITPGALLRFYVNSKEANQTAVYQPGGKSQLDLTVAAASTQTRLSSSLNPSLYGQGVTLTAVVTASLPGSGTPAGQVTFIDGETPLVAVSLNGSGQAVFTTPALASGSHLVSARYGGNAAFQPSSGNLTQVVYQPAVIPGQAWAWGNNDYGQLGNGTTSGSYVPVQVSINGTVAITTGYSHCLAIKSDGSVWAWGYNEHSQLGNSERADSSVPVQINGLHGVSAVAAGYSHSMALKSDGTVWAWGDNYLGQLGNGTNADDYAPVQAVGLSNVISIAAGYYYSLALKSDGTVWGWGLAATLLGTGNFTGNNIPVQVSGLTEIIALAAGGSHCLALKSDGTVWAWGANWYGQLGIGSSSSISTPVAVSGLGEVISISAGVSHSLVLKSDGTVWAWGSNQHGQLGNNIASNVPAPVSSLSGVMAIDSGGNHNLALKSGGSVWSWGWNDSGQLGNGNNSDSITPAPISQLNSVTAIRCGASHSLALKSDGTVWAWGNNINGQLGTGTPEGISNPVQVANLSNTASIAGGEGFSLAAKSDGTVWAWGTNSFNQLGNGSNQSSNVPSAVDGLSSMVNVAAGLMHSIVLKSDGTVWAWGRNTPPQVLNITDVKAISAGGFHSLALKTNGTVWSWGSNSDGQLGNGTNEDSNIPVQVSGLNGVSAIAAGGVHSLAVKSDGTVWAWGWNAYGELGDGTETSRNIPVQVVGLTEVVAVAGGDVSSLALKADGTVWEWGYNHFIQLGVEPSYNSSMLARVKSVSRAYSAGQPIPVDFSELPGYHQAIPDHKPALRHDMDVDDTGGNIEVNARLADIVNSPVQVTGISGATAIAAGGYHSLALRYDGSVWAWGANYAGQLGNGTYTVSFSPVQVAGLEKVTAIAAGRYHSLAVQSGAALLTSTILHTYPNPSISGQKVALTVFVEAVPPSVGILTGYVTFKDGQTVLANCMLDGNGKTFFYASALLAGSHNLTAVYSGDENFPGSVSPSVIQVVYTPEECPPYVYTTSPSSETNGISLNTTVMLNFSKPMDQASVQSAFSLATSTSGNQSVSGNFSWNAESMIMTFIPFAELCPHTTYSINLNTSAKDIYGIHLAQAFSSTFTTQGASVSFQVVFQGGSRPESGWNIPLTVKLFSSNNTAPVDVLTASPLYSFSLTASKSGGTANALVSDLPPGTYDITAVSPHCLTNVLRSVAIGYASIEVDMGTLLEGDANNDNIINIQDFGLLAATYGQQSGQSGFDERADFDCNGTINISDFGLLAVNFHKNAPVELLAALDLQFIGLDWYCQPPLSSPDIVVGYDYNSRCISTFNLASGIQQQVLVLPEARGMAGKPSVYGDKVAFVTGDIDFASAGWTGSGRPLIDANLMISVLDMKTGELKNITAMDNNNKLSPKIFGDTVVWFDARNNQSSQSCYDIYSYDFKTDSEKRLSSTTSATWDDLVINDDWVVWRDVRHGKADHLADVYAYDLKHNIEKRLTSVSSRDDWGVALSGDHVIWTDSRNLAPESLIGDNVVRYDYLYNSDIYLYDLADGLEQRITAFPGREHYAAIDGNHIVWVRESDERSGDVFAFDIDTGRETQVSHTHNAWSYQPAIYGSRVFWVDSIPRKIVDGKVVYDGSPGVAGIYLFDLDTGRQSPLAFPAPPPEFLSFRKVNCYPRILSDQYVIFSTGDDTGRMDLCRKTALVIYHHAPRNSQILKMRCHSNLYVIIKFNSGNL